MKKRIVIIIIILLIFAATIAAGFYLIKGKNNSAGTADTRGKTGSNFDIGEETIPKDAAKPPQKTGTVVKAKSTKEIVASAPKQIQGRLVRMIFKKMPFGENKSLTNTLILVYYDDAGKKTIEADYVFYNRKFFKNPNPASVLADLETVPVAVIELGYEGMKKILLADAEYKNERAKYPQLFGNCSDTLLKSTQFGWEWITACSASINGKNATIAFATNLDTKKVSVVKKENLE